VSIETATPELSLHPDHLADLREGSALSAETLLTAGIRSLAPAEWPRYLSPWLAAKVQSCYLIPYPQANNFYRAKLFPPIPDKDGHTVRYYQPAGTAPRLYLPPRARAALADPSVPLLITEGEKKALKADQEGQAGAALGGLWSWLLDGQPLPDLDRVDWCERETILVPDSDVWTRPDLLRAVYALGKELEARGARLSVLKLPAGENGTKVGLDDYLCEHSANDLLPLPRLSLDHKVFRKTADWWREWTKRKSAVNSLAPDALSLLERGETVRLIHPAQDMVDGVLLYGVTVGTDLVLVTSKREAFLPGQPPHGLALRHTDPGSSSVSREVALRWLTGGAHGSIAKTLHALSTFFERYVVFRNRRGALWVAAWSLGTWCHRGFRIFPYLALRSAEKRCGKTRLLNLLARVCFNASPVTTFPTEAQLYRAAARNAGTQLFDEVEHLRGDKERLDALISVLNTGFEQGGVVTRLEKRGEKFMEVHYEVFAPRALAGLAGLKDTLEDRSFPLFMVRKRRDESVARLTRAVGAEAQALRDQCALACLAHIENILTAYDQAPTLLEREAIDDRAVDLWSPLIALTLVADAEDGGDRTARLLAMARELSTLRDADAEAGQTFRLIEALEEIRHQAGEVLTPTELLDALKARSGWDWVKTTRRLAGLMNPLGLVSRFSRHGERKGRFYLLEPDTLADLRARFSPAAPAEEEA
jgi:hypothetical protein